MRNNISFKLALKNIFSNKLFNFAHILASSMMIAMVFVCHSLLFNKYLIKRSAQFLQVLQLAIVVSVILAVIFMLYSTRFINKGRKKEFALYGILGLEKKHILRVIFVENIIMSFIIFILSTVIGYVEGSLGFMISNKLLKDTGASLQNYGFSTESAYFTLIIIAVVFVMVMIVNSLQIGFSSPVELLSKGKVYEKEPKIKWLMLILGLILLGAGYYIALSTDNILTAIKWIIIAILIVVAATYLLYVSLSIFILKMLKRSKKYYYKKKHFMFINNMMSKMMSNGVALASIAVLVTGVILTMTITYTVSKHISNIVDNQMQGAEYRLTYTYMFDKNGLIDDKKLEKEKAELKKNIQDVSKSGEKVNFRSFEVSQNTVADIKGSKLVEAGEGTILNKDYIVLTLSSLDSYRDTYGKDNVDLKDDEILVMSNSSKLMNKIGSKLTVGNNTYRVKKSEKEPRVMAPTSYLVVYVKNVDDMMKFYQSSRDIFKDNGADIGISWSVKNEGADYTEKLQNKIFGIYNNGTFEDAKSFRESIYQLNGGLIMAGIIISLVLMLGGGLILYFKQITEAFDDRENIQIMKKVGLDNKTIRQTLSNQIAWVFLSPLVVAFIHCLVACKIISIIIGIFGFTSIGEFFINMSKIGVIFAVIYLIFFVVTSRIYYKIVK